jgi:hypothetical protein
MERKEAAIEFKQQIFASPPDAGDSRTSHDFLQKRGSLRPYRNPMNYFACSNGPARNERPQ